MSSYMFDFHATIRSDLGKGASRRLRREERVPAIVYGGGHDPLALELSHHQVQQALKHESVYSHLLNLHIEGLPTQRVVLKDLQRHPYKPRILHMDFLRVSATEKLHMHVPLHFLHEDQAPGVKREGGVITHHMIDVEISCLPDQLPEFIGVDLANLHINQAIHLSDLALPAGVTLVALAQGPDHDLPVVSIHAVAETPEETSVVAPGEVEASKVKKADDNAGSTKDKK